MNASYASVSARANAAIRRRGALVTFLGVSGTKPVHSAATGTFSGGALTDVTVKAVKVKFNPRRFEGRNLVLVDPITLMVEGPALGFDPVEGMYILWNNEKYKVQLVDLFKPADTLIYAMVTASR